LQHRPGSAIGLRSRFGAFGDVSVLRHDRSSVTPRSVDTHGVQFVGRLSPEEFWARYADMEERVRATAGILPCYGLTGWSGLRMIGDWTWENDRLVTVGLVHGAPDPPGPLLHVHTTLRDPRSDVGALRMAAAGPPRAEDDRFRRYELDADDGERITIAVDTATIRFTLWGAGDAWWAAGHDDQYGLVLEGRRIRVDEVRLERVYDLEPYLAGRRAYLRQRRGEA
jgi:hypothetical protein